MAENILQTIVASKRQQNEQQALLYPLASYQQQLQASDRSLYQALSQPQAGFILECKKASPSKGLIRADFNPVDIARQYQPYAAAISVLTESEFFQGQLDYVAAVRASVHQPVLCKDFFISEEQVYRARYFGADAVLLMLSVLDDAQYQRLASVAEQLQMDVLTEVANEAEMHRAVALNANIIGINHRDLTNLTIDPNRSAELSALAPRDALLVAESGFSTHADIRRVSPYVNGFLVGSALTAQDNIDRACRRLLFGDNKICGLTRVEDALSVAAAGTTFGGMIFAPHSPRCIELAQAQQLAAAAPALAWVGVFADQPLQHIVQYAQQLSLYAIQLHGHEDVDFVSQLRQQLKQLGLGHTEIWQALSVDANVDLSQLSLPLNTDRYVLDNGAGGTGKTFDWSLLQQLPSELKQRCILAGGISPDNVQVALSAGLAGVDSSSQLERAAGVKLAPRVMQLLQQIRTYGRFSSKKSSQDSNHSNKDLQEAL